MRAPEERPVDPDERLRFAACDFPVLLDFLLAVLPEPRLLEELLELPRDDDRDCDDLAVDLPDDFLEDFALLRWVGMGRSFA